MNSSHSGAMPRWPKELAEVGVIEPTSPEMNSEAIFKDCRPAAFPPCATPSPRSGFRYTANASQRVPWKLTAMVAR